MIVRGEVAEQSCIGGAGEHCRNVPTTLKLKHRFRCFVYDYVKFGKVINHFLSRPTIGKI